jgi:hypothetical protein
MQGNALRRVLVVRCLRPADKERVHYRSTVGQVWEYLDWAYMRQDVFLHNLMKPVLAFKELGEKNCRALEEYLDLLLRTFDIAEEAGMLPIVLHQNNLWSMYENWPHGEQAKWCTHAKRFDIMDQPEEFRRYINSWYYVVATLASQVAISSPDKRTAKAGKGVVESPPEGHGECSDPAGSYWATSVATDARLLGGECKQGGTPTGEVLTV